MNNNYSRKLTPRRAYQLHKNQDPTPLNLQDALSDVQRLITHIHGIVQDTLDHALYPTHKALQELDWQRDHEANEAGKRKASLKPAEEARLINLRHKDKIHPAITQKYRVEQLANERIVSALKKWDGNYKNKPNAGYVIHLGTVIAQMVDIRVNKRTNTVWIMIVAWDRKLLFEFNLPKRLPRYTKVCKPSISMNPATGQLTWSFCFETTTPRPPISQEYNLGIDRGKIEMGTWSINHISTDKPVLQGFLSDEVRHILGKIKRIERECRHISKKH